MLNFIKKYKFILLAAVAAIVVLVIAFVSGGSIEETKKQTEASHAVLETAATETTVPVTEKSTSSPASTVSETTVESSIASSPYSSTQPGTPAPTQAQTAATAPATQKSNQTTNPVSTTPPAPVKPQEQEIKEKTYRCTISISCATILNNMDKLNADSHELVPADGWLFKPVSVEYQDGESVFDVLQRVCRENKIHMEFSSNPVYNTAYIEAIGNLYEFDCGANSGWMYCVNGWYPNYGCSQYAVKNGDVIEWKYTCNLGYDIGGGNVSYSNSD